MERFTKRDENGKAYLPYCFKECGDADNPAECGRCRFNDRIIEKLAEYEDAEENGLLVRLPCKMGSKVYSDKEEYTVTKIRGFDVFELEFIAENDYSAIRFYGRDIGKTVFLTQAEAEAKLREMEDER